MSFAWKGLNRHASHPYATNAANDPVTLPAFAAVAKELMSDNPLWSRLGIYDSR